MRQLVEGLHLAEMAKKQNGATAAASAAAAKAIPAQPAAAGLLLTTSGRLNYGANPAPSPATPDDVQPNVGRATMPSLRATPVLDC